MRDMLDYPIHERRRGMVQDGICYDSWGMLVIHRAGGSREGSPLALRTPRIAETSPALRSLQLERCRQFAVQRR